MLSPVGTGTAPVVSACNRILGQWRVLQGLSAADDVRCWTGEHPRRLALGHRFLRKFWLAVVVVGLFASCSSGPERSVDSFCDTLRSEKERILAQLEGLQAAADSTSDDFAAVILGLGGTMQAVGELQTYFVKLAEVAPEEIRTEAEIVAQEYEEQLDAAGGALGDPLGALGASIFSGFTISGPLNTMNAFAVEHCGESI